MKAWPRRNPVLRGLDLSVERGELVWIGGDNGAGKTTLLRVVTGVLEPSGGRVSVCGLDGSHDRLRYQRMLGFLSAGNSGLYARLTVAQHLKYWSGVAFVPRERRRAVIADALDHFNLHELASQRTDRISMGQRQRLRIAMAFLPEPDLVLLDEPRTSLDAPGSRYLGEALARLRKRGGAAVVCSPTPEDIGVDVDRSYVLAGGTLGAA